MLRGLLLVVLVVLTSACFEHPSSPVVRQSAAKCSPAGGRGGEADRALPGNFPKDLPIFPGARFFTGSHFGRSAAASWQVNASTADLKDYYEKNLQAGDWQLFGIQYTDPCLTYWHVERRSDSHYGGFVSVYSPPGGAAGKFISASMGPK